MMYLVDSNFFIQAHRDTYPMDVVVNFWKKVESLASKGTIFSIDKVKNEIYGKNDELEGWCEIYLPTVFFKDSTKIFQREYLTVLSWAYPMKHH